MNNCKRNFFFWLDQIDWWISVIFIQGREDMPIPFSFSKSSYQTCFSNESILRLLSIKVNSTNCRCYTRAMKSLQLLFAVKWKGRVWKKSHNIMFDKDYIKTSVIQNKSTVFMPIIHCVKVWFSRKRYWIHYSSNCNCLFWAQWATWWTSSFFVVSKSTVHWSHRGFLLWQRPWLVCQT